MKNIQLACVLLLLGGAADAQPALKVIKQIPRGQRTESPTLDGLTGPRIMDRGRSLYYGRGLWGEQHRFYLVRLADGSALSLEAPIAAFFAREQQTFPGAKDSGHPGIEVRSLLFYDSDLQQAGILLVEQPAKRDRTRGARRLHYLHWDLAQKQIRGATLLGEERHGGYTFTVTPIGYDHATQELFCQVVDGPNKGADPPYTVSILALGPKQKRTVAQLGAARAISGGPYHDLERKRALVVEYAELPVEGAPPRGYLVDLASGKQSSFEIPVTTYGVAFDPDGKTIYLYSSQLGKLMAVDAATGKRGKVLDVGTHGHALGFAVKGTLLVLRNGGLQFVDAKRLVKKPFVPMKRLYPGFSHVEGSLVAPGRTVIKNGSVLHLVETR